MADFNRGSNSCWRGKVNPPKKFGLPVKNKANRKQELVKRIRGNKYRNAVEIRRSLQHNDELEIFSEIVSNHFEMLVLPTPGKLNGVR